jgi:allantoicase
LIGFDIDTANFTGNEGPAADVWGLQLTGTEAERETEEKKLEGDDVRVSACVRIGGK